MAGSTMVTSCTGTVIDVLAAVISCPAVDTDAVIATMSVVAGPSILASIGHQFTFVHIFCAVLTCVMRWALAIIRVHSIHTHTTVLTVMAWAIIDVMFTVRTCEAW